jgi:hypothetical protein
MTAHQWLGYCAGSEERRAGAGDCRRQSDNAIWRERKLLVEKGFYCYINRLSGMRRAATKALQPERLPL